MNRTTFIYALICPDTGNIKYVGKANDPQRRFKEHLAERKRRPGHKANWIKSLLALGKQPGIIILEEVSLAEWQEAERRWIKYYRSVDTRLANVTEGGQGGNTWPARERKPIQKKTHINIDLPDDLSDYIIQQAEINQQSPNKYIEYILTMAMNNAPSCSEKLQDNIRVKISVQISDELNDWLEEQAALNRRSKNKQLEHILSIAQKMPLFNNESRHTLNSPKMCYNGQHHFKQADPAASDFCNCGVFVYGEVVR